MLKQIIKNAVNLLGYDISINPVTNRPTPKPVAFIHIAKCGGVSIDNALRQKLATSEDRRLCRTTSIASSIASFNRPITTLEDSCDFGEHHLKQLQGTLDYFLSLQRHYISGHWGVNEYLLKKHDNTKFITVLREPIARLKSNYIFNKLTNNLVIMPPNKLNVDNLISEANDLLNSRRGWQMANTQTAFICGHYPKDPQEAISLQQTFLDNLSRFEIVGFLNDLNAFSKKFEHSFHTSLNIKSRNSTNAQTSSSTRNVVDILTEYFESKPVKQRLNTLCYQEQVNFEMAQERFA
ncbi:sulfotransferase family 2 domain-containing protein [Pseudoalteromonas sp. JBTF-M23]|uniref:Sulfotransferase family 2 domain-containing protein n=1 Tax=Pseudoalteromonas caenipelagi TaxID=2726988 RepID=A0A849VJ98_9GAMM|nr:sulfotransferase family 2 domain-containing protein [Pseudoalteromonas caenipelagi]NOU51801.1 sulfotransferase family 2 domain-containing protein [Pseudoalteromonas caenipelagi]